MIPTSHNQGGIRQGLTLALDGYPELDHGLGATPIYQDLVQLFAKSGIVFSNSNDFQFRRYFSATFAQDTKDKLKRFAYPNAFESMLSREQIEAELHFLSRSAQTAKTRCKCRLFQKPL